MCVGGGGGGVGARARMLRMIHEHLFCILVYSALEFRMIYIVYSAVVYNNNN